MLRLLFFCCVRRIRSSLQLLEFLHFMLCGGCLSLFSVQTRQPEMRLRRERTVFFDGKKLGPFLLSYSSVALDRSGFAQGIQSLWHIGHQLVGAHEFRSRLMHFTLFQ